MRKMLICTAIWTVALLAAERALDQELQRAIDLMETKGDLAGATRLFEEVARGRDRAVAARALLYLGQCHERQGAEKARATYQRIERDFGEQREMVAEARRRVAALGGERSAAGSLSARQVWSGSGVDSEASITPDGKTMAFIDWSTGDIALRDMASGRIDRLMAKRGSWEQSEEFAEWPALSPDQKQLVYAWFEPKLDRYQFRSIPNQRGAKARTLVDGPQFEYFVPAGWSTDGKSVLATIWGQDKTAQIGWISAETGAIRTLRSLEWRDPWVSLSPDGQYVAYTAFSNNESTNRQLYLLAADGSSEVVLDDGPGTKDSPVWTPDGSHVVYVSDRGDNNGLWAVRVKNGKPAGAPQLVHRSTGGVFLRGFTRAGTLFYFQQNVAANEFWIAKVDPAGGIVQADRARIRTGSIASPAWSPDGRLVAFHARRRATTFGLGPGSHDVVVRDLETGVEKTYPLNQHVRSRPIWAPDGASLYQFTSDRQRRGRLLRLDLNGGKWTEVLGLDVPLQRQYESPLSPDRRTLFNVEVPENPKRPVIVTYDVASGQRRVVYRFQEGISNAHVVAVSPDGRNLAVLLRMGPARRAIAVVGGDGAGFRQIWESSTPWSFMDWSPDGQWIYFGQRPEEQKHRLMRIPAQGGEPQETGLTLGRIGIFQFSRDATRILYAGSDSRNGNPEYWALDNLTSILNRSKRNRFAGSVPVHHSLAQGAFRSKLKSRSLPPGLSARIARPF